MPVSRERKRLIPSRLFDKSPRGVLSERSLSGKVEFYSNLHGIHVRGGAVAVNNCRSPNTQLGPAQSGRLLKSLSTQNKWYYHSDSIVNIVDDYIFDHVRESLTHGHIWTGTCDNAVHRSQRLEVKPLKSLDWPSSLLGPSWPSFPSITEWMEMLARGIDPLERRELKQPKGQLGFTQVHRSEVNRNCKLATKIVSNFVVGIRSSTEVPRKFLKFFRYAHNFLIITCTWKLPIGLVRFLLAQWIQKPYSLWLRRSVSFKKFLKKVPTSLVKQARLWLDLSKFNLESVSSRAFTSPAEEDLDYESGGSSELD